MVLVDVGATAAADDEGGTTFNRLLLFYPVEAGGCRWPVHFVAAVVVVNERTGESLSRRALRTNCECVFASLAHTNTLPDRQARQV